MHDVSDIGVIDARKADPLWSSIGHETSGDSSVRVRGAGRALPGGHGVGVATAALVPCPAGPC